MTARTGEAPWPVEPEEDIERLHRAAQGLDPDLTALYNEHVDSLFAFVYLRVGQDKSLAEDVVQETFIQAMKRIREYDPGLGTFRTWLRLLSRNVIRDHLRDHRRGMELAARSGRLCGAAAQVMEEMASRPLADELVMQAETRCLVDATMADLPESYRKVLEDKYIAGMTAEEIADQRKMGIEAAKSLLARARRAFRDSFLSLGRYLMEDK